MNTSGILLLMIATLLAVNRASAQAVGEKCLIEGEKIPLVSDCSDYIECRNGKYDKCSCNIGHKFDSIYRVCRWSILANCFNIMETANNISQNICSSTKLPCSKPVPVINDCQGYCNCTEDEKYTDSIQCENSMYFDVTKQTCVSDKSVCEKTPTNPQPKMPCEVEGGTVPAIGNCKIYFQCIQYKWEIKSCPFGSHYDIKSARCSFFFYECRT